MPAIQLAWQDDVTRPWDLFTAVITYRYDAANRLLESREADGDTTVSATQRCRRHNGVPVG